MKKLILIMMLVFGCVIGTYAQKTVFKFRDAQARAGDAVTEVCVKPTVVEVKILEEKGRIKDVWTLSREEVEVAMKGELDNIRAWGTYLSTIKNDCDVIMGATFKIEDDESVLELLNSFGKAEVIKESLMDAVIATSGSSPAYVFMFIEAMADAAVAEGMPRAQAYQFAAQSVLGSAKMVLETGKHPGELKDMVCSPAGTTIEAVRILEKTGFRSSIMECMKACADKSRNL